MKKKNLRAGKTVKSAEEISASMPARNEELTTTTEPTPAAQGKAPIHIPPILLEGDESPEAPEPPRTQKYTIGPTPMVERFEPESRDLPEAYGTGKLLLTPRDPHWLYAHWDLSREQQRAYNDRSAQGHLVVRVHPQEQGGATEVHLHPESRHWFVEVGRAGISYVAELGYYQAGNEWVNISTSSAASTPPDQVSEDKRVQFATRGGETIGRERLLAANDPQATDQGSQTQGIIPPRVEWLPALGPQILQTLAAGATAEAALALGAELVPGVVTKALVLLLEEAKAALPSTPSAVRARVLARLAAALQPSMTPEEPMVFAREAVTMARALGDDVTLRVCLHTGGSALVDFAEPGERRNA